MFPHAGGKFHWLIPILFEVMYLLFPCYNAGLFQSIQALSNFEVDVSIRIGKICGVIFILNFRWYFVTMYCHILKVAQKVVQIKVFNISCGELCSCHLVRSRPVSCYAFLLLASDGRTRLPMTLANAPCDRLINLSYKIRFPCSE